MADIEPAAGIPAAPPITGYRRLTHAEVQLMNRGKALGETIKAYLRELEMLPPCSGRAAQMAPMHIDRRWLAIGTTDLQTGLMAVLRAIARPTTF